MAFDGVTVAALVKEFNTTLKDGRIYKIAQTESDELMLTFKADKSQYRMLLSANASLPLIYFTNNNKPSPMTAPNFCMLLRKHINNGRIVSITQPGLERIVDFEIQHLDELGDIKIKHLIIELMGKHSNIIFCDENDQIIDSIKHISIDVNRARQILPGDRYCLANLILFRILWINTIQWKLQENHLWKLFFQRLCLFQKQSLHLIQELVLP